MKTTDFPYCQFPFEEFNPIQSAIAPLCNVDCNLVVSAPTSAGKTEVGEIMCSTSLARGEKIIWLSPLRALSNEKYEKYIQRHYFRQYRTEIITGDYTLNDGRLADIARAHIIIMTSEMLDSRTRRIKRENNDWLLKATTLVIDELHLISMPGRGSKLESAIIRFSSQNPSCRIVGLSATIPSAERLKHWFNSLNGKPTALLLSDHRPVRLEFEYQATPSSGRKNSSELAFYNLRNCIRHSENDACHLVFCHTRKDVAKCTAFLREAGYSAEAHTAIVNRQERQSIEERFRNRELKIVVATTTLAWGLNMPARYVHILGIKRAGEYVNIYDLMQMAGRAGRYGIDPFGKVIFYIPSNEMEESRAYLAHMPAISSEMNTKEASFHLCAEIENETVIDQETMTAWWHKTFKYSYEHRNLDTQEVVTRLTSCKAISIEDEKFKIENVGRIAAWLYFDPWDVYGWLLNLNVLNRTSKKHDSKLIAWIMLNVSAFQGFEQPDISDNNRLVRDYLSREFNVSYCERGILCLIDTLARWLDEQELTDQHSLALSQVTGNSERTFAVMRLLDKFFGLKLATWLDQVEVRVRYGVKEELAELCSIRGVGRQRARQLFNRGIRTRAQYDASR